MNDEDKSFDELLYEVAYLKMVIADMEDKYHQAEDLLKVVTEQYKSITGAVSDYIFSVHVVEGKPMETIHGPSCLTITGYSPKEFSENSYLWITMVHEEDRPSVLKHVANILTGKEVRPLEHRIVRKDGVIRWVVNVPVCQYDENGKLLAYDGLIKDITDKKNTQEALKRSEEKYRLVADFTYDWEQWVSPDGNFVYVSPSCERITGYSPEEFVEKPSLITEIVHADDRESMLKHYDKNVQASENVFHTDFRIITRNGDIRWISHNCQPVYGGNGSRLGRRGSNRDITPRKNLEDELRSLLLRDELTGLHNRRGFFTLAEHALKTAKRLGRVVQLFVFDIENFGMINNTYGHESGDRLLKDVAQVLSDVIRESDILSRIGNDEFGILVFETGEWRGNSLVSRIAEKVREYNKNRDTNPYLCYLIGNSAFDPEHPVSLEELLIAAEQKLSSRDGSDLPV